MARGPEMLREGLPRDLGLLLPEDTKGTAESRIASNMDTTAHCALGAT